MIAAYLTAAYLVTGAALVGGAAIINADLRRSIAATWWIVVALVVAWPAVLSSRWRQ